MITDFDFQILNFLQQYCRTEELDWFFSNITRLGNAGILWILFAAILLLIPKTRRCGMIVSLALLLDFVVCNGILKNLIARIRPYDINTAVELLIEKTIRLLFPFWSYSSILCCSYRIVLYEKSIAIPSFLYCSSDCIFPYVSVCTLSNGYFRWRFGWNVLRLCCCANFSDLDAAPKSEKTAGHMPLKLYRLLSILSQ